MPVRKMKEFLDTEGIKYVTIIHSPAFTAAETAATAHIHGKGLAKVVMVKLDGDMAMAVVPSTRKVDIALLREVTGADQVDIATEKQFRDLFSDCEAGAMPPFGNLYGMEVYVSADLSDNEDIAFNAGSHTELVRMSYMDFERLVNPKILVGSSWH
ncbi:MAG: aminoacyl-tRNA deacylase [Tepidisphaerales bacterium]